MGTSITEIIENHFEKSKIREYNIDILLNFLEKSESTINKICIVGTPYGLLLYLLFIEKFDNTLFVFYGNYPLSLAIDELRKRGFVCLVIDNDQLPSQESDINSYIINYIARNKDIYSIPIYGQDTSPYITNFIDERFTLFEDGRISYINREDAKNTKGFRVNIYDQGIKSIIYTGLEAIPSELKNIAKIVDIKSLWNSIGPIHQKIIMEVFGFDTKVLNSLLMSGRDTILFTRNYAKAGKCSAKEQILLYQEILSKYDKDKIIIKPHPNDNLDYSDIFKEYYILPKNIPSELIWLCNLPVKRVVSVDDSSNLFGFLGDVKIDLYPEMLGKHHVIQTRKNINKQ